MVLADTPQEDQYDLLPVAWRRFGVDLLARWQSQAAWLPPQIAPFEIVVTTTNVSDEKLRSTAETIAQQLESAGYDVLLDDRDERPGVKFKDADLVGIPFRINVGKKVTEDRVEVVQRSTRQSHDVSIAAITDYFRQKLA